MALQNKKSNLSLSEMFARNVRENYTLRSSVNGSFIKPSFSVQKRDSTSLKKIHPKPSSLKKSRKP